MFFKRILKIFWCQKIIKKATSKTCNPLKEVEKSQSDVFHLTSAVCGLLKWEAFSFNPGQRK